MEFTGTATGSTSFLRRARNRAATAFINISVLFLSYAQSDWSVKQLLLPFRKWTPVAGRPEMRLIGSMRKGAATPRSGGWEM